MQELVRHSEAGLPAERIELQIGWSNWMSKFRARSLERS